MPGGNKKNAQRTKGNAKPSSSSQAAQLLTASGVGGLASGFIGFGSAPGAAAFVPVSQVLEEEDSGLDAAFRLTLRKLSKRDTVTKLKALQEFSDLCRDSEEDAIKATLPFWPKIYNKLSMDIDHKVRGATQAAMAVLVTRVGRNIAPHLKHVMGCWLLGLCDTYPTVATEAKLSFETAFPSSKQTDAIVFCKDVVAEFLTDNLTQQTASTLSDPKTCEADEMEMKYNRVVTSSLLAWRLLLDKLPPDSQGTVPDTLNKLLSNHKLWKFAKSTVLSIRAAVYSFLAGVCQHQSDLALTYSNKISPLVLHNIDESENTHCCSVLWEAVLAVVTYLPDCWSHINAQKAFLPKLRKLLQNGCYGNAATVGFNLLPLLSKIPDDICGSRQKLLEDIFQNLKQGLCQESIRSSPKDMSSLVSAYMECAQYSIKQSLSEPEGGEITHFLLIDQVFPLLEASFVDEDTSLFKSPLYTCTGSLLRSLGQSDHSTHDHVTLFRQEITRLMLDNVEKLTETDKGGRTLERMSVFLWAMIDPIESNVSEIKKSVKFSESADGQDLCGSAKSGASLPVMKQVKVEKSVKSMVTEVCMAAVKNAVLKHCTLSLALLKSVTTILTDPEVLEPFLKYFKLSQGESDYDKDFSAETKQQTASMFVHLFTIPWIETINDKHERSAEQRIGHLLDMTFAQFGALMQTDVVILLSKLLKTLTSPSQFRLLVERCLIWRSRDQILTGWFRGAEMGERLVTLTLTVCETSLGGGGADPVDISLQWGLIASVLGTAQEEEPLLEGTVIERILGVIHQSLSSLEHVRSNNRLETAIHFITDVMLKFFCSIKGCLLVPSAESLLLTLFSLSLEEQLNISEDCSQLLEEAWCRGVTALVQQRGGLMSESAFLTMGAHAISVRLSHITSRSSLEKLQKTVQVLLTTVRENLPDNDLQNPTLQSLFTMMSAVASEITVSKELLQFISVRDELLSSEDTEKPSNLVDSPVTLPTVVYPSLFSARLLYFSKTGVFRCPVPNVVGRSSSSELTKESADIPISDWNDESISHVLQLLYSLDLCEAYGSLNQMKKPAYTEELNELEYTAQSIVTSLGINARKSLVMLALEKSETEGWIWAKTLGRLLSMVLNMDSETEFSPPDIIDRYSSLTLGKVHTLQVSGAFMTVSDRRQLTELMVARVISSDIQQLTDIDGVLGSLAVTTSLFPHLREDEEIVSDLLTGVVTQLMMWRQEASIAMPDDLAGEKSPSVLTFNLTVMRFLTHLIDTAPEVLTDTSWDYVLCALIGWLQNVEENHELLMSCDFRAQELCISSSRLLASVAECIQSNVGRQTSELPANLATEWEEFFSEGSFSNLLPLFLKLTGSRVYRELGGVRGEVVSCVSHAVSYCPQKQAVSHQLPPYLIPSQDSHIEDSIQTLLNHCCPMLLLRCRSEQIAAYWLLSRVIGEIPAQDKDDDTALAVTQAEATRSPPMSLIKVLITAGSAMEVILYGLTVEDYLKAPPHTEEFHYTLGYLLSWKLLLNFFSHVPNEVRPQYAAYLKERGIVFSLLSDLFRLMPDNPSLPAQGSGLGTNMFEVQPKLSATDCDSSRELPHLACCVYRGVLETVPAMARQWWRDQDRKTAAYVDKFSTRYVSPLLCNAEIQSVQGTEVKMDNIVVKARAASREVIATYTLEEVKTEMVISLPPNYPLGNISVTPGKRVGVTAAQWDKWLLQLNIFLQHQNGNIVDGLKMWKRNIDKRFEGVEECTICYSVIHGTTLQLPRLQCRTCKNKFHSACLYKWFSTSHNSTCPLCRNLF